MSTDSEEEISYAPNTATFSSEDEKDVLRYPEILINNREVNALQSFKKNYLTTAKYTWWNFLPKNIIEQFRRMTNVYFLLIVLLSLIPEVSAFSPMTTVTPLLFVLTVSAIKEAYEDLARHKADDIVNGRLFTVLQDGEFVEVASADIKVGDIVYLKEGDEVPADVILLASSNEKKICFVQTANLDGESNLKIVSAFEDTSEYTEEEIINLKGVIEAELPDRLLHLFSGNMLLKGSRIRKPLGIENLLLRGVRIENTKFVYGVVIYSGKDTKLALNLIAAPFKFSQTEARMNAITLVIFFSKLSVCILITILFIFFETGPGAFLSDGDALWLNTITSFLIYFSLLSYFIPISLAVTLEIVKLAQAVFMRWDTSFIVKESYGPTNTIIVNNSNLNDELGRVSYLFSDKTGTLTQNSMIFNKASVGGVRYEDGNSLHAYLTEGENVTYLHKFLLNMMLNNVIVPEKKKGSNLVYYQGPSPDEIALSNGAQENQYVLKRRNTDGVDCVILGKKAKFQILQVLDFTSDRKRMTVVVRDSDGIITVYSKGSDEIMLDRILNDKKLIAKTQRHIDKFSNDGLRTLIFGEKNISEEEFEQFNAQFLEVSSIIDREKRETLKEKVMSDFEQGFNLIGCTAVEDLLQVGVPDTIHDLLEAGIKVWIITGDKQQTATNIAYSCKLLKKSSLLLTITATTRKEVKKEILKCKKAFDKSEIPVSLVITGKSLVWALSAYPDEFKRLSMAMDSVVCCRTGPLQKAEVVRLIKNSTKEITLAIGDGANDAAMLSEAHVGVGLYGKEGSQAARQSDYALHRFRQLKPLLFKHGRYSLLRSTKLIYFGFYKNIAFFLAQLWFAFFNGYSGYSLYDDFILVVYNVVIIGLPPFVLGLIEKDLSEKFLMKYPHLYAEAKRIYMDWTTFFRFMISAIYQSLIFFFVPYFIWMSNDVYWEDGHTGEYWLFSTGAALPGVLTVLLRFGLASNTWSWMTHFVLWGSFSAFVLQVLIESILGISVWPIMYHVLFNLFSSPVFWLTFFVTPVIALLPDIIYEMLQRQYFPYEWQIQQEKAILEESEWSRNEVEFSTVSSV